MFSRSLRLLVCAMALTAVSFVVGCEEEKEETKQAETTQSAPAAKAVAPAVKAKAEKPAATPATAGAILVKLQTSKGDIVVELNAEKAPVTVANFVSYVNEGHYSGKIFHRVMKNFMIQGGNFTPDMKRATTKAMIVSEANNGLKNVRGAIAMARLPRRPDSATDQFYICDKTNPHLDYAPGKPGYAVFGKVVEGMDTVDAIASVQTGSKGGMQNVPVEPVLIVSAKVISK